jgi:penicillin-binding protein 1C
LLLRSPGAVLDAGYFVSHVLDRWTSGGQPAPARIVTTLDPHFQLLTQQILDSALSSIAKRKVRDGAVLVIDTERNEIQAWVVGRSHSSTGSAEPVYGYDTLMTPRQPGSTMKPLLYALALERGWTAATLIDDSEMSESVAGGQHTFHNYSHVHYGPLRLREALGNSLNIPAVRTLKFVGEDRFLDRLHALGVTSLTQHPDFYGDGLALGNGEVSLYEMAQAYTALARQGNYLPIACLADEADNRRVDGGLTGTRVFSPEVATLIANILADPDARMREFGSGLQFPVETAIKTGTSTDYRDAWAIAFDYRHTVAVWMGNLDGTAMDGVTGAVGPAMVLRSVFSELNRNQDARDLPLSRRLLSAKICRHDGRLADDACASTDEWFLPGTLPVHSEPVARSEPVAQSERERTPAAGALYRLLQPTAGLHVAHDPRIPKEFEALPMQVAPVPGLYKVVWYVDGREVSSTSSESYAWPLLPGAHEVYSRIWDAQTKDAHTTDVVRFYVH